MAAVDRIEIEGVPPLCIGVGVGSRFPFGQPLSEPTGRSPTGNEPCLANIAPPCAGEPATKLFDSHPVERKGDVRAGVSIVRLIRIARGRRYFVLHLAITLLETRQFNADVSRVTQSRLRNVADCNLYREPLLFSDRLFGEIRRDPRHFEKMDSDMVTMRPAVLLIGKSTVWRNTQRETASFRMPTSRFSSKRLRLRLMTCWTQSASGDDKPPAQTACAHVATLCLYQSGPTVGGGRMSVGDPGFAPSPFLKLRNGGL